MPFTHLHIPKTAGTSLRESIALAHPDMQIDHVVNPAASPPSDEADVISGHISHDDAASYGKPVVSTSIGAEGLELKNGEEIIIEDNYEKFAEKCVEMLTDHYLYNKIISQAREKVSQLYDREKIVRRIKEIVNIER